MLLYIRRFRESLKLYIISEGWLRNEKTYGDSVTLRVRLHSLITSNNAKYFSSPSGRYENLETYLSNLIISNGTKYQIININLDDVDDDFAKVITKVYSRLLFEFTKGLKNRASIPFHILVEEAHRYIQNDTDRFLIGYNIFERIAKEGRKYGLILGLISQRPVELSDTVISQCSNFLIFKMNHPVDVDYIRKMVPNISDDVVEKQKTLQSGTCLGFGSAFKIPLIVKLKMPDPMPKSGNCDVVSIWNGNINISHTPSVSVQTQPVVEETKQSFITQQGIKEVNNQPIVMSETTQPVVEEIKPSFITPQNMGGVDNKLDSSTSPIVMPETIQPVVEATSPTPVTVQNTNIEQTPNNQVVSQPSNVINFGVSTNNQPISPMPATDTISPIPEVMPGDNNGNTPPTFM